ncbi:MAG: cbb3-type cytochrome oxidase assembly protein CcoS [Gemmatimonadales bacterium]
MSVLFLVVPLAIVLVAVAVGGFLWSSRNGQFDDLDTPALRVLHDDESVVTHDPGLPPVPSDEIAARLLARSEGPPRSL